MRILAASLIACLSLVASTGVAADDVAAGSPPVLDVVLLLDNSGSMKKNDPQRLTPEVVSAFAGRMPPAARLAIVVFDERVRTVLPFMAAATEDFGARVRAALEVLGYAGKRTELPSAVERALYMLREEGRPGAQRVIVFMTDGIVDVGNEARSAEQARWLRESLATEARQLRIPIFGIALSDEADFQLIQSVAQTTGGAYYRVLTAGQVPGVFEQVSARLAELARPPEPPREAVEAAPPPPIVVTVPVPAPPAERDRVPWVFAGAALLVMAAVAVVALRARGVRREVRMPKAVLYELVQHTGSKGRGTTMHVLGGPLVRIGREKGANDIVIPKETISVEQAVIEFREGTFHLRDRGSLNGTFHNGTRVTGDVALKHRDRIAFDTYEYEFVRPDLDRAAATRIGGAGGGGTVLAKRRPAAGQPSSGSDGEVPVAVFAPEQPADVPEGEAETRLKQEHCESHASAKATELCPACRRAWCPRCMREKDGRSVCWRCAGEAAA